MYRDGEQQPDDVAGIVPRIGEQRERRRPESGGDLDRHEGRIETHADAHGPVEVSRRQPVRVRPMRVRKAVVMDMTAVVIERGWG